jgi:predicted transcriptional regulator
MISRLEIRRHRRRICNCSELRRRIVYLGGVMKKDLESMILTRQELQIMKVVWEQGAATVKEVCHVLSRIKPTAYTTVLTLMGILEDKGALAHSRSGRAYVYHALLSRQQATRNQVRDVLVRFFDGQPEKLIANVLDNEVTDPDRLRDVRSLVQMRCGEDLRGRVRSAQLVGA